MTTLGASTQGTMSPDDLSYAIDVTGLDPASLTDALRAVMAYAMADPLRM
jgi:hypothetical protein